MNDFGPGDSPDRDEMLRARLAEARQEHALWLRALLYLWFVLTTKLDGRTNLAIILLLALPAFGEVTRASANVRLAHGRVVHPAC